MATGETAEPPAFQLRRAVAGLLVTAFGLLLLLAGWRAGPPQWRAARELAALTATLPGEVEELWWRLDFDPRPLGDGGAATHDRPTSDAGANWLALTAPELCARLRFPRPTGTTAQRAVFCRCWSELRNVDLLLAPELALGVQAIRAASDGSPALDIRLSERALGWLAAHPPAVFWVHPDVAFDVVPKMRSELELLTWVVADAERNFAGSSSAGPAAIDVAYDPADPRRAAPAALRNDPLLRSPLDRAFPLLAGGAGLVAWCAGWVFLLGARGRRLALALVIGLAGGLTVPIWGERAAHFLGETAPPVGSFVDSLTRSLVPSAPLPTFRAPDYRGEPGDRSRPWAAARDGDGPA